MTRWKPNAPERLAAAALDLFEEHGYDSTTVSQITERAGLTKSSFFRHFTDKREVLFDGATMTRVLVEGIEDAPDDVTALDTLTRAFLKTGEAILTPERRDFLARRSAVIRRTPELQEREALKELGLIAALSDALQRRGVPELTARVVAELGALAFAIAYDQWLEPGSTDNFDAIVRRAVGDVRAVGVTL